MLSDEERQEIEAEVAIYAQKRAACIEALKVVQQHRGWVSDEAIDDLLGELRVYAERFFEEPIRYMAGGRAAHAGTLLRFALAGDDDQRSMLAVEEEPADAEVSGDR